MAASDVVADGKLDRCLLCDASVKEGVVEEESLVCYIFVHSGI